MDTDQPRATCGAKCRDGHPCRTDKLMPNGRCRMHGGKSPSGIGHHNYRHGFYSKGGFGVVLRGMAEQARHVERVRAVYQAMREKGPVSHGAFRRLLRASRRRYRPDKT